MDSSQFGITFTDSRGPVNSDGPIHCIRSLNRMVRYSVMSVCVMAGKLFQEYTVDSWATTEQHRLKYLSDNQTTIRAETYQGLTDAVAADPTLNQHDVGQHIILPFTFSGSSRNMIQHCQDALTINHYFHGADPFLTMTANPNWPEIKEALLPGQTASDRPDLVDRVFHAKVKPSSTTSTRMATSV